MSAPDLFQTALAHHEAGRLPEAERIYRQVLATQPNHAGALHYLGVIAYQMGHHAAAQDLIGRSIVINPDDEAAFNNLGNVFYAQGLLDQAITHYRRATELDATNASAQCNLGTSLMAAGENQLAVLHLQQAIQICPANVEAHCNLGNAFLALGNYAEAIAACHRVLELKPDLPQGYSNLANALWMNGEFAAAIDACQKALAIKPDLAEGHNNLGNAYWSTGDFAQAIAFYRNAVELLPHSAQFHYNLGAALKEAGQYDEAMAEYRRAIELKPNYPEAYNNLGSALKDCGDLIAAMAAYRKALELRPEFVPAHSNLVYTLTFSPVVSPADVGNELRAWAHQHADGVRPVAPKFSNVRSANRRLRIGYISPDFCAHVVGRNILPLVREHNPSQFEVFCYANNVCRDWLTDRFRATAEQWRDIRGKSDEEAVEMVRSDQIDILVDLSLHMAENRLLLFARRPASVQVTFAGYPGTTGLSAIDYRLSDPFLDPPDGDASIYSEETIRLPHSFWCYDSEGMELEKTPPPGPLPARNHGFITFGCLNNFCKVNADVLQLWARVMSQVPRSRMKLMAAEGQHRDIARGIFQQAGIDPQRIEFVAHRPRAEYFAEYQQIDLGLDTLPYNGHTTSLDSLWMGVPVVTLVGDTIVGRAGWSQLSNLNLTELAACSPDEFVRIAAALANDWVQLESLRAALRERMKTSPLMDPVGFTRGIEAAYLEMWRNWCAGATSP